MEFANDLLAGLRGKVHGVPVGAETPGFDWPGLHARLTAAHAARAVLGQSESPLPCAAGSFAICARAGNASSATSTGVHRRTVRKCKESMRVIGVLVGSNAP